MVEDNQDEEESNTDKPDNKQGDRPVTAEKVAPIKAPMTEKNLGKVAGIKLNNVPRERETH